MNSHVHVCLYIYNSKYNHNSKKPMKYSIFWEITVKWLQKPMRDKVTEVMSSAAPAPS